MSAVKMINILGRERERLITKIERLEKNLTASKSELMGIQDLIASAPK